MLFSWTIALFTWLLLNVPVMEQTGGTCTAHAVKVCGEYAGYLTTTWDLQKTFIDAWGGNEVIWIKQDVSDNYMRLNMGMEWIAQDQVKDALNNKQPIVAYAHWFSFITHMRYQQYRADETGSFIVKGKTYTHTNKVLKLRLLKNTDYIEKYVDNWMWHTICVVGYTDEWVVFQNSYWVQYGDNGFWLIKWEDTKHVDFRRLNIKKW